MKALEKLVSGTRYKLHEITFKGNFGYRSKGYSITGGSFTGWTYNNQNEVMEFEPTTQRNSLTGKHEKIWKIVVHDVNFGVLYLKPHQFCQLKIFLET